MLTKSNSCKVTQLIINVTCVLIALGAVTAHGSESMTRIDFEDGIEIVVLTDKAAANHDWKCNTDAECQAEEQAVIAGKVE